MCSICDGMGGMPELADEDVMKVLYVSKKNSLESPEYSFYEYKGKRFIVTYFRHNCNHSFDNGIKHPDLEGVASKESWVPCIGESWKIRMFLPKTIGESSKIAEALEQGVSVDNISDVIFSYREKIPIRPKIRVALLARLKWD